jgi:hypothetical protein
VPHLTEGIGGGRVVDCMRIIELTALIDQGSMLTGPVRPRTTADQARIRSAVRAGRRLNGLH